MRSVLLDTGVIVALLDRSERCHATCVAAVAEVQAPLVTCEPVIAEACYLLRRLPAAVSAVLENVERGIFQIHFRLDVETHALRSLLKKYARVPMDLADACLVLLATQLGTGEILTLDGDFEIYRWGKDQPFRLLVAR